MHLILNSSTGTFVTVAISTALDGGFHCKSMCLQVKPAHILHNKLREDKVQIARRHQGGTCTPIPHPSAWISLKMWEGTGKATMASH